MSRTMHPMRLFADAFFTHFGASVYPDEDELLVDLPPDLAAVFGKSRLYLVFSGPSDVEQPRRLSSDEDLLVYGSRTFDLMFSFLAKRGLMTQFQLPNRLADDTPEDLPAQLPLHNCRLTQTEVETGEEPFYLFNFRLVYAADQRREEILTVPLNAAGEYNPGLASLPIADLVPVAAEAFRPVAPDDLTTYLKTASSIARKHAEKQTPDIQAQSRTHLHRNLRRLTAFYQRLIDEVNTGDPEADETARLDLKEDLKRKAADELESHRLEITITPISYALALLPLRRYRVGLTTSHSQLTVSIDQNLYSGQIESPRCHHSQERLEALAVCDRGHLVQLAYLKVCTQCGQSVCERCGIAPCAVSGDLVCANCTQACPHCERWISASQVGECTACGEPICVDCAGICVTCGMSQCPRPHCGGAQPTGECATCGVVFAETAISAPEIPPSSGINPARYQWRTAENPGFRIYAGQSWLWGGVLLVCDKQGQLLQKRRLGLLRHLKRWLTRVR